LRYTFLLIIPLIVLFSCTEPAKKEATLIPEHVMSRDLPLIEEAFLHGYTHNIIYEDVDGEKIPTLTIQCTSEGNHRGGPELQPDRNGFSIWTRDLYWGFQGWNLAGDDRVLKMMKSSLVLLIEAKARNQALGQSELWPLNNQRFYIPQAYTRGLESALNFYPWCSESQADFLLMAHDYWKLSDDIEFIKTIWDEIEYITQTLELLDTDGNALPDAIQGSYDYMWIKEDSEEPLMCAKTSLAYQGVSVLAQELGKDNYADHLSTLADRIKEEMNLPVEAGGLWKQDEGYYIQMRALGTEQDSIHDLFIPYNNLVPMWCEMTSREQDSFIFAKLDGSFNEIYDLEYGPMYCAPAGKNEQSVMDCSSVTWLAFLDVYLRGKKGHEQNRDKIFSMLMEHAGDAGGIPFPEGAGVYGYLTGGAGRSWDNGNFFHMLIAGIYGIEKDKEGITLSDPDPLASVPLTELRNVRWRDAVYDFSWEGKGTKIRELKLDGKVLHSNSGTFSLHKSKGHHIVTVSLSETP
jgi:hypothetical protein